MKDEVSEAHVPIRNNAFTLVELIVVIVILSILATIAFLSFSNRSSAARDSARLSDLSNIAKGLGLNQAAGGTYPIPDRNIRIYAKTGTLIGFQGEAGSAVLNMIRFSADGGKDPLDKTYYTYSSNLNRNKYQLLAFLESSQQFALYNPFLSMTSYAADYSNRFPYERGDALGVILSKSTSVSGTDSGATIYTPIQDIAALQLSSTGFIIEDAAINTGMVAIQDNSNGSVPVTASNLEGFTTPVNPIKTLKTITMLSDITSSTDLYTLSDKELKYIFESGSYYTQNWSSFPCNTGALNVITMNDLSAAFTIPENTIVKVPDGIYSLSGAKTTSHITFGGNCSALIGQSNGGVLLNSSFTSGGSIGNGAIVNLSGRNNVMLINLKTNGNRTSPNRYRFIYLCNSGSNNVLVNSIAYNGGESVLFQTCTNGLIANSQSYDNTIQGFMLNNGSNNLIRDSISYNNYSGFDIENGAINNIINNSISFNNSYGFLIDNARNNSFNNTISFNNSYGYKLGISTNGTSNNFFNNMQSFNNLYGFWNGNSLGGGPVILNGGSIYNNNIGFLVQNTTNNRYYGVLKMFGTSQISLSGTTGSDAAFIAGSGGLLGWSDGTLNISSSPMDCSYHIKPNITSNWGNNCETIDKISAGITLPAASYSYGSNIQPQLQPIKCPNTMICTNGTSLIRYGSAGKEFDPAKKIGER